MKNAAAHNLPGRMVTTKEWLYLRDIITDARYQRPLDEKRVGRIVKDFDPDAVGLPFVSEGVLRGKTKYATIDGQHRIAALRIVLGEDQMIECEVVRNVGVVRAAQLFRLRNTATKLRAIQSFLAGVTAGDEQCVAINKIVESAGLRVSVSRGDEVVQAVTALQKVYRGDRAVSDRKNALPLKRTLMILKEAWGPSADAFNAESIHGLGLFMTRHGDVADVDSLTRKLKSYPGGAVRFLGDVRGLRSINGGGMIAHAAAEIITRRYNTGLRKDRLPDWRKESDPE